LNLSTRKGSDPRVEKETAKKKREAVNKGKKCNWGQQTLKKTKGGGFRKRRK